MKNHNIKRPQSLGSFFSPYKGNGLNPAQEAFKGERAHQVFIQYSWLQLSAIACHEYLQRGRGAILLDLREAEVIGVDTCKASATYVALSEEKPQALADYCIADTLREMGRYDPEREVIFMVLTPDGKLVTYTNAHLPVPAKSLLMVETLGAIS